MNLQKMMQQAQQMQQKIAEMQKKVEAEETEGSSGGGAVKLRMTGKNKMLSISIDASLLKPEEKEVLEDLIVAAHNDARSKIDENFNTQMNQISASLNLPPGFKLPM